MGFWHSGDGKYRLYSDAERREYGQKIREGNITAFNQEWVTKTRLKTDWNWTDKAIEKYLSRLKLHTMGRNKYGVQTKAYKIKSVQKVEDQNVSFQEWMSDRIFNQYKKSSDISKFDSNSFASKVYKKHYTDDSS